jgi:hypothetical protein
VNVSGRDAVFIGNANGPACCIAADTSLAEGCIDGVSLIQRLGSVGVRVQKGVEAG